MLSLFSNHWSLFLDLQGRDEYIKYQYVMFISPYLSFKLGVTL